MRIPKTTIPWIGALAFGVACLGVVVLAVIQPGHRQRHCCGVLRSMHAMVDMYRNDQEGLSGQDGFPTDLTSLLQYSQVRSDLLACPGAEAHRKSGVAGNAWSDYWYVNWSQQPRAADWSLGQYPLIYDRCMANHEARGINIVRVDGTLMWDGVAAWLRKFAADHPGAEIPMPE